MMLMVTIAAMVMTMALMLPQGQAGASMTALLGTKVAARYLGLHPNTLVKMRIRGVAHHIYPDRPHRSLPHAGYRSLHREVDLSEHRSVWIGAR